MTALIVPGFIIFMPERILGPVFISMGGGAAEPQSKIAILASNITWNAYNAFGGRSNYINPERLPAKPVVNSRQELERYTDPDNLNYGVWDYALFPLTGRN